MVGKIHKQYLIKGFLHRRVVGFRAPLRRVFVGSTPTLICLN